VVVFVARLEPDLAGLQQRAGVATVRGPALEQARRHERPALRVRQPIRPDRRPGVQQDATVEHRDGVARGDHGDGPRRGLGDALQGRLVGLRDPIAVRAPEALERRHGLPVTAGRRAPVDVDGRRILVA
jgi:hypothetical protein